MSMSHECGRTGLNGSKLEIFDPIHVGPRRYNSHGSGQVGQGSVQVGHGGGAGRFFLISQKKINRQKLKKIQNYRKIQKKNRKFKKNNRS
jgi:hypothetical protein